MKAASLRYQDTKFQHPSPGASPPTGAPNSSGGRFRPAQNEENKTWTWVRTWTWTSVNPTVGYPSNSWASCQILWHAFNTVK